MRRWEGKGNKKNWKSKLTKKFQKNWLVRDLPSLMTTLISLFHKLFLFGFYDKINLTKHVQNLSSCLG
jgi:hypothetical protein